LRTVATLSSSETLDFEVVAKLAGCTVELDSVVRLWQADGPSGTAPGTWTVARPSSDDMPYNLGFGRRSVASTGTVTSRPRRRSIGSQCALAGKGAVQGDINKVQMLKPQMSTAADSKNLGGTWDSDLPECLAGDDGLGTVALVAGTAWQQPAVQGTLSYQGSAQGTEVTQSPLAAQELASEEPAAVDFIAMTRRLMESFSPAEVARAG